MMEFRAIIGLQYFAQICWSAGDKGPWSQLRQKKEEGSGIDRPDCELIFQEQVRINPRFDLS